MDIPEANKKATLSYAMIVGIIAMVFWVTTFYHNQSTIESRMNKRYERTIEALQEVEADHAETEKRLRHLEDNCK